MMHMKKIRDLLSKVYPADASNETFTKIVQLVTRYRGLVPAARTERLDQRDSILITYADQLQQPGKPPLQVLAEFCQSRLADQVTGVHILPFYPWTSDDGFSVVDYREVDPRYGSWEEVDQLGRSFRLMFDAVINHISMSSTWFQSMLAGDARFENYFVVPEADDDLSRVVRPRALPLLTSFQTATGEKKVWTTFSADQVDLNYSNPDVLIEVLDVLLFYVSRGAEFIRLDAIAYLWKEPGTSCINLPETHAIIQLIRAVLDELAPHVMLITETNVPHRDNISYFGDGTNEAQMVYNFSLPPLVLHAFQTGSAETLSDWASGLVLPSDKVTFFNFLASHDGIGLNPLRGILPESEIEKVIERVLSHGGLVSYKSDVDGSKRAYELNINYFDALNDPNAPDALDLQVERFVTAHAILLAMRGVPAIYFHSLFGSRGWPEGATQSGHNRTINRKKLQREDLEALLSDPKTREARVFSRLMQLLRVRREHPAFDPHGDQKVISLGAQVFAVLRISPDQTEQVLCLHNLSHQSVDVDLASFMPSTHRFSRVLIGGESPNLKNGTLPLAPYDTVWLSYRSSHD